MQELNAQNEDFQGEAQAALEMRPQLWNDVFVVQQPVVPWGALLQCLLWIVLSFSFFFAQGLAPLFLCSICIGLAAFQGLKAWANWSTNESTLTRQQLEELVGHHKRNPAKN